MGRSLVAGMRISNCPLPEEPQTCVNLSSEAMLAQMAHSRAKPGELLVAVDDVDFSADEMRLRQNWPHPGQNRLRPITANTGAEFPRICLVLQQYEPERDLASHMAHKSFLRRPIRETSVLKHS